MKHLPVRPVLVAVVLACLLVAMGGLYPAVQAQNGSIVGQSDTTAYQSPNAPRVDRYRPENFVITARETGFEVAWDTARSTDALILYGPSIHEMTARVDSMYPRGTNHRVIVDGLEAYKVYYFVVVTPHGRYGANGSPFKLITTPDQVGMDSPPQTPERVPSDFYSATPSDPIDAVITEPQPEDAPDFSANPRPAEALPLAADALLSDGQFPFGPNVDGFDTASYIAQNMPELTPHAGKIEEAAAIYSINPRVLLTFVELGLLAQGDLPAEAAQRSAAPRTGFVERLDQLALTLFDAYYGYLHDVSPQALEARHIPPITLASGEAMAVAPQTNAGSYAILSAIGTQAASVEKYTALTSVTEERGFLQTYHRLFPGDDPLSQANHVLIPGAADAIPPVGLFQLPYPVGQAWQFNGIHGPQGPVPPYASIDFWPVTHTLTSSWRSINAATSGTFTRNPTTSKCQVEVKDPSGWSAVYYHLEGIPASLANGAYVARNTFIGYMADTYTEATCHDGTWPFAHDHFTLKYNGQYQDLNGATLARWKINRGSATGYSCTNLSFTKGSATRTCGSWVLNHPDDDNSNILNGQTFSAAISPTYDSDRFSFTGQQGQQVQIWMTRVESSNPPNNLDSYLRLYDSNDVLLAVNDDYSGLNSYINFTLPKAGTYQIITTSFNNSSSGSFTLKLQQTMPCTPNNDQVALFLDNNYLGSCVIKNVGVYPTAASTGMPNNSISSVKVGSNVVLRLYDYENYGGVNSTFYGNDTALSDNTIGNDKVSSLRVEKRYPGNMALNKPAWASSVESSSKPAYLANDGNTGTRWSSKHSSTNVTEKWRVDLGSVQSFDMVKIWWEAAYAATYAIGWSNDGVNYTAYNYSLSAPGYYHHWLGQRSARYVMVFMYTHAPCCANFSIWETEVYSSTKAKAGEFLVEPLELPVGANAAQMAQPLGEPVTIQIRPTE